MKAIPSKSAGLDSAQSGLCAISSIKNTLVTNGRSPQLDCEPLKGEALSSISKKKKKQTTCPVPKHMLNRVSIHTKVFSYIIC